MAAGEIVDGVTLRITDYVCSAVGGKHRVAIAGQCSQMFVKVEVRI